eukprot:6488108-Amphidinium_carterae.1
MGLWLAGSRYDRSCRTRSDLRHSDGKAQSSKSRQTTEVKDTCKRTLSAIAYALRLGPPEPTQKMERAKNRRNTLQIN